MSIDRPLLIGIPAHEMPKTVEICRSYAYKLNLGQYGRQYESADFFASRKMECATEAAQWVSEALYEECVAEVREAVKNYIAEMRRKEAKREDRGAA